MRLSSAVLALAAAASSVSANGWLPALLTPQAGDVFQNGQNLTITWDTTGYNSSANDYAKFLLGYAPPGTTDGSTTVAQFVGRAASFGNEYKLWEGENSVTFTLAVPSSNKYLSQQVWSIVEFPLDQQVQSGLFTIEA
ncbi:hypothetical protein JCM8547_001197 [Rhodosporidiobolus lusitaniae]